MNALPALPQSPLALPHTPAATASLSTEAAATPSGGDNADDLAALKALYSSMLPTRALPPPRWDALPSSGSEPPCSFQAASTQLKNACLYQADFCSAPSVAPLPLCLIHRVELRRRRGGMQQHGGCRRRDPLALSGGAVRPGETPGTTHLQIGACVSGFTLIAWPTGWIHGPGER
jgi:hypothetical protein